MTSLTGKLAIVTGASRGIGLAIAKALVREGVRLGLLSRSRPAVPGDFVSCDFADLEQIPAAVGQRVERLGTVDFLINNAGTFLEKPTPGLQLADWERVQRVNLTAPFLITREVLPRMITRQQGRIINIASTASTQGYLHQSAYCASKHGLLGFARSLAIEVKPHNWLGARAPSSRWVGLANRARAMPKVEITVAFAAVSREHRAAKGMSQDVLAEKADIHPTHVGCVVEHGQALAPKS